MTQKVSLHGEVNWQRNISRGGSTGLSVNAGLRWQF